jgi:Fe-S oxidoreductase
MKEFGFTISEQRQIDFEANDRSIADYIYEREPSFRVCIECLRELQILLKRGENDKVRENIMKCMLCGKCTLVCPRGVNTRNVVTLAREAFQNKMNNAI